MDWMDEFHSVAPFIAHLWKKKKTNPSVSQSPLPVSQMMGVVAGPARKRLILENIKTQKRVSMSCRGLSSRIDIILSIPG